MGKALSIVEMTMDGKRVPPVVEVEDPFNRVPAVQWCLCMSWNSVSSYQSIERLANIFNDGVAWI